MFIASEQLQNERKKKFNAKYIETILELLKDGVTDKPEPDHPETRSWVWNAQVLFEEGYYKEANYVIRTAPLHRCEFMPMQLTQIFQRYDKHLEPDVREKAEAYIKAALPLAAADRIHPSMYNDNFGNMATYTLLAAGEYFNLPEYVAIGRDKLQQFCDLFSRCGALMEYCSPVYSPIHLLCFSEMVNHLKDPELRQMAAKCEERMWIEMATHYHPETDHLAGPYSRAYTADTIGHPNIIVALFWKVFGDRAFINPLAYFFPPRENQVIHISIDALALPNDAWLIGGTYHFPEYLVPVALEKKYPYHVENIVECIPADALAYNDEDEPYCAFGGHRSTNRTYMTKEFSMGTAMNQYHSGSATEGFYVTYKNCEQAKSLEDTGVIFAHYIFNDKRPNHKNTYAYYGNSHESSFRDEGRKFGIQQDNTSLVAYKPLQLEGKHVTSARLTLFVPCHFFEDFEIYAGGKKVTELPFASAEPQMVCLRAYHSLFAFVPLALTDFGRVSAVKIEKKDQHLQISFYNYEGPERSFEPLELIHAQNGFVCIAATTDEFSSIEAFARHAGQIEITDRMELSAKMYTRRILVKSHGKELYFIHNPLTESNIVSTTNKKPMGLHILKADMLEGRAIPFLED